MIELESVDFKYPGNSTNILEDFNLTVEDGEFLCVIGHSGCGKSTLLRLVAGLDLPQKGEIRIDGSPITGPGAERTIVFQQYSLFPWLTVKKNVLFALKKSGKYGKKEASARAELFLEKTGLRDHMDKYPYQLSGGMRQRTAIARALALDSPFLLLDEPFGALDTKIRKELQTLLKDLWEKGEQKKTVIFVTHDLDEAMIMGSRIVFIRDGKVRHEKRIDSGINCCCRDDLGQADCLQLKEELARWYE
ncbi:MAG: ABC transporter ATP-binding protein [Anaerovoracaceae bacterium]